MQIGQVPVQFVPEPVVNDTRSLTVDAEPGAVIAPSLRPGEAEPDPEIMTTTATPAANTGLAVAGLLAAAWLLLRMRRRR